MLNSTTLLGGEPGSSGGNEMSNTRNFTADDLTVPCRGKKRLRSMKGNTSGVGKQDDDHEDPVPETPPKIRRSQRAKRCFNYYEGNSDDLISTWEKDLDCPTAKDRVDEAKIKTDALQASGMSGESRAPIEMPAAEEQPRRVRFADSPRTWNRLLWGEEQDWHVSQSGLSDGDSDEDTSMLGLASPVIAPLTFTARSPSGSCSPELLEASPLNGRASTPRSDPKRLPAGFTSSRRMGRRPFTHLDKLPIPRLPAYTLPADGLAKPEHRLQAETAHAFSGVGEARQAEQAELDQAHQRSDTLSREVAALNAQITCLKQKQAQVTMVKGAKKSKEEIKRLENKLDWLASENAGRAVADSGGAQSDFGEHLKRSESRIDESKHRLEESEAQVDAFKLAKGEDPAEAEKFAAQTAEISRLRDRLRWAEKSGDYAKVQISAAENDLERKDGRISRLEGQVGTLRGLLDLYEKRPTSLGSSEAEEPTHADMDDARQKEIIRSRTKIDAMDAEAAWAVATARAAREALKKKDRHISRLKKAKKELKGRLKRSERMVEELQRERNEVAGGGGAAVPIEVKIAQATAEIWKQAAEDAQREVTRLKRAQRG